MGAAGRVARQCPHGGRFVDHDLEMDFAALVRSHSRLVPALTTSPNL
jgi:hypothetical protein